MEIIFLKEMGTNEIKNELDEITGWEKSLRDIIQNMKQVNTYMIFNNLKQ